MCHWLCYITLPSSGFCCFFNFWRTWVLFVGATDTPVLDFWWRLLWVSKPEWVLPYSHLVLLCVTCSLRFTFGPTPANLLVVSMAAKPISICEGIGRTQMADLLLHEQTLNRLSYANAVWFMKNSTDGFPCFNFQWKSSNFFIYKLGQISFANQLKVFKAAWIIEKPWSKRYM